MRDSVKRVWPLLMRAVVIWVSYGMANVFGMRHGMSLLSGTYPVADANVSVVMCVAYLGLYVGAVVVAPMLVIAALLEVGMRRLIEHRKII